MYMRMRCKVPVAPDGEPRLGAPLVRRRQLAAAAAPEPHQLAAPALRGQLAVPEVANPAPAPALLLRLISGHLRRAPVDVDIDHHMCDADALRGWSFPSSTAGTRSGFSGGDHHGRLLISCRHVMVFTDNLSIAYESWFLGFQGGNE